MLDKVKTLMLKQIDDRPRPRILEQPHRQPLSHEPRRLYEYKSIVESLTPETISAFVKDSLPAPQGERRDAATGIPGKAVRRP
jgi:hypothetical protein